MRCWRHAKICARTWKNRVCCGDQDSRHTTTEQLQDALRKGDYERQKGKIDVDIERERQLPTSPLLLACASMQPQNVASQPVMGKLPLRRGLSESFAIVMKAGTENSTAKLGAQ